MATRKNMRFKGASAKAGTHHADRGQARYLRKQAKARRPLSTAADRRAGTADEGHELHTQRRHETWLV